LIHQWVQAFKDWNTSKKMPAKKKNVKLNEDLPKEVKQYDRKWDPLENAIAERVKGILKTELLNERFHSFAEAQEAIAIAISTYNHLRPHNSIGDLTPFEVHSLSRGIKPKCLWKNYYKPKPKEVEMEMV
jgi:Integrase core domain.